MLSSLPDSKNNKAYSKHISIGHAGSVQLTLGSILAFLQMRMTVSFVAGLKALSKSKLMIIQGSTGTSLFNGPPNTETPALDFSWE